MAISGIPGAGGQREVVFNLRAQVDPRSQKAFEDFKRANGQAHLANSRAAKKVADDELKFTKSLISAQLSERQKAERALARMSEDAVRMQERAAQRIAKAHQVSALKTADALQKIGSGALAAARGIALFAASGEEDLQKLLGVLIRLEAGYAVVKGGVGIAKGVAGVAKASTLAGGGLTIGAGTTAASAAGIAAAAVIPIAAAVLGEKQFEQLAHGFIARVFGYDPVGDARAQRARLDAWDPVEAGRAQRLSGLQTFVNINEQFLQARQKELELVKQTAKERLSGLQDELSRVRALGEAERARLQSAAVAFGQLGPAEQSAAGRLATRARLGGHLTRRESERLRALGLQDLTEFGNAADIERARRAGFDTLAGPELRRIGELDQRARRLDFDIHTEQKILLKLDADFAGLQREISMAIAPAKQEILNRLRETVRDELQLLGFDPRSVRQAQERVNAGAGT